MAVSQKTINVFQQSSGMICRLYAAHSCEKLKQLLNSTSWLIVLIKHETRETEVLQGMSEVVDMWQTKCSGTMIFSQLMCQHIARDDFLVCLFETNVTSCIDVTSHKV